MSLSSQVAWENARQYLAVRAGERDYALPVASVVEVLRPYHLDAGTPERNGRLGYSLIRGRDLPVFSLAAMLGGTHTTHARLVRVRIPGGVEAAIAVDAVHGLRPMQAGEPVGFAQDGPLAYILARTRRIADVA